MNSHSQLSKTAIRLRFVFLCVTFALSGCATYTAMPLPEKDSLQTSVAKLTVVSNQYLRDQHSRYHINPNDGLDLTELAIIGVLNNPDLKVKRKQMDVAGAQAFAAGLLPDPQLSGSLDHPTGDSSGLVNATSFGIGIDLSQLITRQANIDASNEQAHEIQLNLLWQEWQLVQEIYSTAIKYQIQKEKLTLLYQMQNLYHTRYQQSDKALSRGDTTLDINGTDLTTLVDNISQINQLQQLQNETYHKLNYLLGLSPEIDIKLADLPTPGKLDEAMVQKRLSELPNVRPDLLALKAGYQSQESKVRAAILAQFPSISIGISRSKDTGGVYTSGFNIGINLPIFNGNRGNIAIERATRSQLKTEYEARLAKTQDEVSQLRQLGNLIDQQISQLDIYLPRLEHLVKRARSAYQRGEIDALTFINMESTWINKRLEKLDLYNSSYQSLIALRTLMALPVFTFNGLDNHMDKP